MFPQMICLRRKPPFPYTTNHRSWRRVCRGYQSQGGMCEKATGVMEILETTRRESLRN